MADDDSPPMGDDADSPPEDAPPPAPTKCGDTWLLASQPERTTCLLNAEGEEYFPHLLVLCSAETGKLLGMGSTPALTVEKIDAFVQETQQAPLNGAPRIPAEIWVLSMRGELGTLIGPLGATLEAQGTATSRKGSTAEVDKMLDDLSAMLAKQHATKRSCHVCDGEIPADSDSRCAGCQAVYYCGRPCQVRDWKEGGHKVACARFKRDMRQRNALQGAVGLSCAKDTMAADLSRAGWVSWLEDHHPKLHR